ncbi:MAG: tetratricopeptide repeat protein, partial [Nitrosomonadales bacterium]|nr:tetratricopeptide repeat protein [Nitrosomonadales bacterium]
LKSTELLPNDAEAHYNLANTLKELARLDEAEATFRQALRIKPGFVEAHNNLGLTLHEMDRLDEAEASYRRALRIKPDFVEAHNNLALLLNAQGKSMTALNIVNQSLQIRETTKARDIFVACVKHIQFPNAAKPFRDTMVRAMSEPWGRPNELAKACADLVKLDPTIGECITRATSAWPRMLAAQELFDSHGLAAVAADPLLRALLNSTPICDIKLERFLTMCRWALLDTISEKISAEAENEVVLGFYSALARQCFINEYVFFHTDDEIRKAGALRDSLVAALEAKAQAPALWLVAVAAYFPLYSVPLSGQLLFGKWPEEIAAVLVQQVREPEEELQERATILRLTNIDDEVSLLVQNQYEENPYPRWIKTAPVGKSMTVDGTLRQLFPLMPFQPYGKHTEPEILIAGCGTGHQSIETALRFQGTRVLAIDLSMASLSYAKRKTRELGLSIEYAQADIMKLETLDRSFDVIESVGVLHHLDNPLAGWRVLLSLLRPGGFMKLGFYSAVARRNVARIRTFIAEQGYGSTANEIRRCRQDLMDLDESADFGTTLKSMDFYSISTCRDLLFHVQEHHMTLTGIEAFLRDNNLMFLGFEIDADILHAYKQRFPDDRTATNLGQWEIFENENPDTFYGMYQFWIQKAG